METESDRAFASWFREEYGYGPDEATAGECAAWSAAVEWATRRELTRVLKFVRNEADGHDWRAAGAEGEGLTDVSKRFETRRDAVSAVARQLAVQLAAGPPPQPAKE